jgi:hypothetical protein
MRGAKRFIIGLLFISVNNVSAQTSGFLQTVKGTVTDEQSGNPIASVSLTVEGIGPGISAVTDSLGNFKLKNVPAGRQTIKASFVGYEDVVMGNVEVTSSKEVVLEIKLKEKIKKLETVVISNARTKTKAINEMAVVSARQFSMDEVVRFSGTRNDPSRMAQNYAGVSGTNDARNDIVVRGNSPSGVLWRMDGIDIPNPNHFSTLGSTGGPVSILNSNTLKNSDFLTSAFPAQYGNAIAGVFDMRMRNGNNEKYEFLAQFGFNGFEFGAEGPINKKTQSSFLVDYRYSMVAAIQKLGLSVGTGSSTPNYQDISFKLHIPTKKWGTFDWFGLGGESHIVFPADTEDNLYSTNDGSLRDRNFKSLTGVTGLTNTSFYNSTTSGKLTLAVSGFLSKYKEVIVVNNKPFNTAYDKNNVQVKYSAGYTFNKKFNAKNQLTAGLSADMSQLSLKQDYIPDGDSLLVTFIDAHKNTTLVKSFANLGHRFTDRLSTNLGLYYQLFTFNRSWSLEPRWNMKYQLKNNQSLSFGMGLHSQTQPLEVYVYQTKNALGQNELTNRNLDLVKSLHAVLGYDYNFSKNMRFKMEVYGQYIFNAAVERQSSSFSMLNSGAEFYFPDKTNLINNGKGYNYGVEVTLEKFLQKGFYFLFTASAFNSKYKGSDNVWRNTAFNTRIVSNLLLGKEMRINKKSSFSLDTKLTVAGGQPYTPFDIAASQRDGFIEFRENEAYSLHNDVYWRWDLKLSYNRNGKGVGQKFFIDLQNFTNNKNIYLRTLNPKTGVTGQVNQIGFFPNINYLITF